MQLPTAVHLEIRRFKVRKFTAENQWLFKFPNQLAALRGCPIEILNLTLTHGILPEYRADLWLKGCSEQRVAAGLATTALDYASVAIAGCPGLDADIARQIELDLPRTFPEQTDFAAALSMKGSGFDGSRSSAAAQAAAASSSACFVPGSGDVHDSVRRMLRTFCVRRPDIGYLQSMNFLAAFFLLVFGRAREADAYLCFETLVSVHLAGYYTPTMAALQADSAVASQLLHERMPKLAGHLTRIGLEDMASLFLPRWLLCLFLNAFPADITVRIWDCIMMEGLAQASAAAGPSQPTALPAPTSSAPSSAVPAQPNSIAIAPGQGRAPCVLLEVSLAVLRICQDELMTCRNFGDAVECLKGIGSRVNDAAGEYVNNSRDWAWLCGSCRVSVHVARPHSVRMRPW